MQTNQIKEQRLFIAAKICIQKISVNGPRRYVAGKGNFRSDGARGRGGYYGNGRGFGRGDFANGNGSNGSRGGGYHHQRMVNSRAVPANDLPGNSSLINDVASGVSASA